VDSNVECGNNSSHVKKESGRDTQKRGTKLNHLWSNFSSLTRPLSTKSKKRGSGRGNLAEPDPPFKRQLT